MKFLVLASLFLGAGLAAETGPPLEKREGISYSSKVVHHDPNHPQQEAQSSVEFTLGASDAVSQEIKNLQNISPQYTRTSVSTHQKPRSQTYKQLQSYTQKGTSSNVAPREQSQSFNVGYSVKFGNGFGSEPKKVIKSPKIEADVITGSRKEEVRKPSGGTRGTTRFTDLKKQSATKTRYTKVVTPASFLETEKYEIETPKNEASPWQSLSPSVEIYKSKDLEFNNGAFDHAKALGKSEGFDYSNAIDFSAQRTLNDYKAPENYKPIEQDIAFNFERLNNYENKENNFQDQSSYEVTPNLKNHQEYSDAKGEFNYASKAPAQTLALFTPSNFQDYYNDKTPIVSKLPIDTSLLRDPILTLNTQVRPDNNVIPIHYDTHLMKDYAQVQEPQPTTLAQTAPQTFGDQQEEYSSPQNNNQEAFYKPQLINAQAYQQYIPQYNPLIIPTHQPIHPINIQKYNNLLSEQSKNAAYYQQPDDLKLGYPQNALFNPDLNKMQEAKFYKNLKQKPKMYMVNENLQDNKVPKQTQFKVFGKPRPMLRHEYQKQIPRYELPPRQARLNPKRLIRDYNYEKDLVSPLSHTKNYSRARRYHLKY